MSAQPVHSTEAVGPSGTLAPCARRDAPPALDAWSRRAASQAARTVPSGDLVSRAYAAFVVDPDTSRVQVRIIDPSTQQVIRAVPPSDVEQLARTLREHADAVARQRHATSQAASPNL
jgi:hypothetical protein